MNKVYCQNCRIELEDDDDCVVNEYDEVFCSLDCLIEQTAYEELKVSELF